MTAQAPLAGEPVPGSRLLLDFLHLPGELGAQQRGARLGLGRISSSPPPGLPSPRPLIHDFRILEAWNPLGSAARGPQCCVRKWGASRAWGCRLGPVRLLRGTGAEARPERSVVGQGTTGHPAGVGQAEKVASEGPERGPWEGRAGHRP